MEVFILIRFSECFSLFAFTSRLLILVIFTVKVFALMEIIFSIKKGNSLDEKVSSSGSIIINLGNFVILFSESDTERLCLFIGCICYMCYLFFAGPMLYHPQEIPTFVLSLQREMATCLD